VNSINDAAVLGLPAESPFLSGKILGQIGAPGPVFMFQFTFKIVSYCISSPLLLAVLSLLAQYLGLVVAWVTTSRQKLDRAKSLGKILVMSQMTCDGYQTKELSDACSGWAKRR
jgi:hypothetical protein